MVNFEEMTPQERMEYEMAHTETAKRRYVEQEYKRGQVAILSGLFILCWVFYMIGPMLEKLLT